MVEFDEVLLEAGLADLSLAARLAFAAAAAARQLPSYELFATLSGFRDPLWPSRVLEQVHEKLRLNDLKAPGWGGMLEELMERIPAETPSFTHAELASFV